MDKEKILFFVVGLLLVMLASYLFFKHVHKDVVGEKVEERNEGDFVSDGKLTVATFAGGCFWCMEPPFEKLDGVVSVVSGYAGGEEEYPAYKEVASGLTGHVEAVQVEFDPGVVSYEKLLDVFWQQINPTDAGGQFGDRGRQYSTAIFYHDEGQKKIAEESKKKLGESGRFDEAIETEIREFTTFYVAENYHQNYYKKSPIKYGFYRRASGRDKYLEAVWGEEKNASLGLNGKGSESVKKENGEAMEVNGEEKELGKEKVGEEGEFVKPSEEELKEMLTPLQFKVTQKNGTEPAFRNEYWDNKEEGIYVDVVSGEPLFSSEDKYASGTGWPSFSKPLVDENIEEHADWKLIIKRTEVRSNQGDSHLGHVFNDGPKPTGKRYCINSAGLRFVPKEKLEEEGYEEFLELFE